MVISLFVNGRCRHLSLGMIAINTKGTTQLSQVTRWSKCLVLISSLSCRSSSGSSRAPCPAYWDIVTKTFIEPMSDPCFPLSVTDWLTRSLSHKTWLIDMNLVDEDGYSMLVDGLTRAMLVQARPLSVSFLFRTSGKETEVATPLDMEKYGRVIFPPWKHEYLVQNRPKSMMAYAEVQNGLFRFQYHALFRSWEPLFPTSEVIAQFARKGLSIKLDFSRSRC